MPARRFPIRRNRKTLRPNYDTNAAAGWSLEYAGRLVEAGLPRGGQSYDRVEDYLTLVVAALGDRDAMRLAKGLIDDPPPSKAGRRRELLITKLTDLADEHPAAVEEFVEKAKRNIRSKAARGQSETEIGRRFRSMIDSLALSEAEGEVVRFLFTCGQDGSLQALLDRANSNTVIAAATGLDQSSVNDALNNRGKLRVLEIVEPAHGRFSSVFQTSSAVDDFLNGLREGKFGEAYYRKDTMPVLPLDSFARPSVVMRTLGGLMRAKRSSQILFYGEPGTGKTELARSLVRSVGRPAFLVGQGDAGDVKERITALVVAANLAAEDHGVVIADEADQILNTETGFRFFKGSANKGWLNDFLDHTPATIIWISNETDRMEASVRRRFDYSLSFPALTRKDRVRIWKTCIRDHALEKYVSDDFVEDASVRFRANASGISRALDATLGSVRAEGRLHPRRGPQVLESLIEFLTQHVRLVHDETPVAERRQDEYDVTLLRADTDLAVMLDRIRKNADRPWTILFWGLPGTGKSEFARHVARELGIEVVERRASDFLNRYVGETERLIRRSFAEAEETGSLLLFDEADSLLYDRAGATHSWERSFVNEFLAGLERFRGIFVATTNMLDGLDPAALRRFTYKAGFLPLGGLEKILMLRRYFPKPGISKDDASNLEDLEPLTPGDFRAVKNRIGGGEDLTDADIIRELAAEVRIKPENRVKRMGFV